MKIMSNVRTTVFDIAKSKTAKNIQQDYNLSPGIDILLKTQFLQRLPCQNGHGRRNRRNIAYLRDM